MRTLEAKTLKAKWACLDQYQRFLATFGESVEVTEALCLAHADTFDFNWAADNLLSPSSLAEFERVMATAQVEYDRVTDAAWAEYDRVKNAAWAEFERVRDVARAQYERGTAPAWAEYARVRAAAFATAYINDTAK